eukprot:scaffold374182_cov23-Prasinocladus_malaysianus.AAC.1
MTHALPTIGYYLNLPSLTLPTPVCCIVQAHLAAGKSLWHHDRQGNLESLKELVRWDERRLSSLFRGEF